MKRQRSTIPSRSEAWKTAAWYALVVTTLVMIAMKLFTPVVFGVALAVAVFVFFTAFAFILRLTPKSEP